MNRFEINKLDEKSLPCFYPFPTPKTKADREEDLRNYINYNLQEVKKKSKKKNSN